VTGWFTRWIVRARATFSGRREEDLRAELELHLDLLEEEYAAQGISPDAARRLAHRDFGNATLYREVSHDLFSFRLIEDLGQDLRYAVRELRRTVGFTCIAIGSLAVGIGAVTTAFAIADAFMLRGLPVREPDRLVAFSTADSAVWESWSYPAFARWRTTPAAFIDVAAASDMRGVRPAIGGGGTAPETRVTLVSSNYFRVMGVDLALGRPFAEVESTAVAVISEAFWTRSFGRTPDILAKTVQLNGVSYDVIGVAPRRFAGHTVGHSTDVWISLAMRTTLIADGPDMLDESPNSNGRWLKVIGRLGAGVSLAGAAASANVVRQRLVADRAAALGEDHRDVARERKQVVSLLPATRGYAPERQQYARPLMVLSGVTVLVLLVACVNFTNLMLARSEGRRREFVIRLALGAGRGRLVRQAATECILLALTAGVFGLLFSSWATTVVLKQFATLITPIELDAGPDGRVLSFVAGTIALVIAFGLWPCTRPALAAVVSAVRQSTSARRLRRRSVAGRVILVAQLSMCAVILIVAGLFLRTVSNLRSQELGFDRNVLLVPLNAAAAGYSDQAAAMLLRRVTDRLSAVPGIRAAGISGPALLDYTNYWVDGSQQLATDRSVVLPGSRWTSASVGSGFFAAAGIPLIVGRTFDDRDPDPATGGVIINQSLSRVLFGGSNPVGRRVALTPRGAMYPVIGVVSDAKQVSPRDRRLGVVYLPLRSYGRVVLAVRTAGSPASASAVVSHHLGVIAPDLPLANVRTMSQVLDDAIAQERLMSALSLVLGLIVVTIGCVGLYALMASDVAQRTHELGIRLALGASSQAIVTMVLGDSLRLVACGLVIGVPLGIAASRPLSAQFYGVQSNDPWTIGAVTVLLTAIALLSALRPAHNASRVDPIALLDVD
jgi:predicted permease